MAQQVVFWTVIGLGGVAVFGLLFGLLIQFLWNATLVSLFDFPSISFWQAVGVFILAKLFFGFGGGSSSSKKRQKKGREDDAEVADAIEEAFEVPGDEAFQKFWREEGKDAYEAYQVRRESQE